MDPEDEAALNSIAQQSTHDRGNVMTAPPVAGTHGQTDTEALDQIAQSSVKPEKLPAPTPAQKDPLQGAIDYYGGHWKNGVASVARGLGGAMALSGLYSSGDAQHDFNLTRLGASVNPTGDNIPEPDLWGAFGGTVEALPYLGVTVAGGYVGGQIGAAGGAALGLETGPAAPAAAPAFGLAFGAGGTAAGTFVTAATISGGNAYLDYLDKGIPEGPARAAALAPALVAGALQILKVGQLTKTGQTALNSFLAKSVSRKILADNVAQVGKSMGIQFAAGEIQEYTNMLAQAIAAASSNVGKAIPTSEEFWSRMIAAGEASLKTGGILTVGAHSVGAGMGAIRKNNVAMAAMQHIVKDLETPLPAEPLAPESLKGRVAVSDKSPVDVLVEMAYQKEMIKERIAEKELLLEDTTKLKEDLAQVYVEEAAAKKTLAADNKAKLVKAQKDAADKVESLNEEIPKLKESHDLQVEAMAERKARMGELDATIDNLKNEQSAFELEKGSVGKPFNLSASEFHQQVWYQGVHAKRPDKTNSSGYWTSKLTVAKHYAKAEGDGGAIHVRLGKDFEGGEFPLQDPTAPEGVRADISAAELRKKGVDVISIRPDLDNMRPIRATVPVDVADVYGHLQAEGNSALENISQEIAAAHKERRKLGTGIQTAKDKIIKARIVLEDAQKLRTIKDKESRVLKAKIDHEETIAHNDAKNKLAAVIKRSRPQGKGKAKTSRFTPHSEIQETVDTYANFIENPELAQIAKEQYAEATKPENQPENLDIEEQSVHDEQMDILEAASRVAHEVTNGLKDSKSTTELTEKLKAIVDDGIETHKAKLDRERKARYALVLEARENGNSGTPVDTTAPQTDKPENIFKQAISGAFGGTWNGKNRIMFQYGAGRKALVAKLDPSRIIKALHAEQKEWLDRTMENLEDETGLGKKEVIKLIVKGKSKLTSGDKAVPDVWHMSSEGVPIQYHQTINEALGDLMKIWEARGSIDPTDIGPHEARGSESVRKGLVEGNKFTLLGDLPPREASASTEAVLIRALYAADPSYISMGKALMKTHKKFGPVLADAYYDVTGLELPLQEMYSGPVTRVGHGNKDIETPFTATLHGAAHSAAFVAGKTGATIEKVSSSLPIKSVDPFDALIQHQSRSLHFKHWAKPSKQLFNPILTDSKLQQILTAKFGLWNYHAWQIHGGDMINQGPAQTDATLRLTNYLTKGAGTAMLGAKPFQALMQATGIINVGLEMPHTEVVKYTTEFMKDPVANAKLMLDMSPALRRRYQSIAEAQMGVAMQKDLQSLKVAEFNEFAMSPLKYGDMAASLPGAYAAYKYWIKQGLSKSEALSRAEDLVENTQASGRVDIASNFSRNPFFRVISMFSQQPQRMVEYEVQAWREYANHPSPETKAAAIKTSLTIRTSQAAFVGTGAIYMELLHAAGLAQKQEVDNAWWDAARNWITSAQLPMVGNVVHGALTHFQKPVSQELNKATGGVIPKYTGRGYDPKSILESSVMASTKLLNDAGDIAVKGELSTVDVLDMALDWARSGNLVVGQVPIEPPIKLMKRILENTKINPILWKHGAEDANGDEHI